MGRIAIIWKRFTIVECLIWRELSKKNSRMVFFDQKSITSVRLDEKKKLS